jgi:hypothetical protein
VSAYVPFAVTLTDSRPRNAAELNTAFTNLTASINGSLETTNNLTRSNELSYLEFHPHAVTESWEGSSEGEPAIWPVLFTGSPGVAVGDLPLGNPSSGGASNIYDADDCCVRFTLPEVASVRYKVSISADEVITKWLTGSNTITWQIFVKLYVDGTKKAEKHISHVELTGGDRPWSVNFTYSGTETAGTHDAWVTVGFTDGLPTASATYTVSNQAAAAGQVSQIVSRNRSLIVEASYEPG